MSEVIKKINELAYTTGRSFQSQETGFLHLSYHLPEDQVAHSIPVLENVLFALSLLRLKTQESVLEAKDLLEKILHFQTDSGNFPIYLHEYPVCHSNFIGADLLPAFHWISQHFGHVLGETLRQRIAQASKKLLQFNQEMLVQHKVSAITKLKLAAISGESLSCEDELFWYIPEQLGEALIALQIKGKLPKEKLMATWHENLHCYSGPAIKEHHRTSQKDVTLYDLYMAALTHRLPERTFKPHFSHLKGALIQSEESFLSETSYPTIAEGNISSVRYISMQEKNFAYSTVELREDLHSKGYHPFYFAWGEKNYINTLVMQGGNLSNISFEKQANGLTFYIDLKSEFDTDEREASKEICFYTEIDPRVGMLVDNQKTTTFLVDQKVMVEHPEMKLSLKFSLEKGEGEFKGHIMRANRPSQKHNVQKDRYAAFDWQIALRTLRRSPNCQIKVVCEFYKPSSSSLLENEITSLCLS